MKVTKSIEVAKPKYPSTRQFEKSRAIMGVAAIGLGALAVGCKNTVVHETHSIELEAFRTAGVMVAEPKPRMNDYLVKQGDTLYGIAKQTLGKGSRWLEITAINTGLTPANLKAGQTIRLPAIDP